MRKNIISVFTFACLISMLTLAGCGPSTILYGQAITGQGVTRISDILSRPSEFDGKSVKIKGKITEECPSGCCFGLKTIQVLCM